MTARGNTASSADGPVRVKTAALAPVTTQQQHTIMSPPTTAKVAVMPCGDAPSSPALNSFFTQNLRLFREVSNSKLSTSSHHDSCSEVRRGSHHSTKSSKSNKSHKSGKSSKSISNHHDEDVEDKDEDEDEEDDGLGDSQNSFACADLELVVDNARVPSEAFLQDVCQQRRWSDVAANNSAGSFDCPTVPMRRASVDLSVSSFGSNNSFGSASKRGMHNINGNIHGSNTTNLGLHGNVTLPKPSSFHNYNSNYNHSSALYNPYPRRRMSNSTVISTSSSSSSLISLDESTASNDLPLTNANHNAHATDHRSSLTRRMRPALNTAANMNMNAAYANVNRFQDRQPFPKQPTRQVQSKRKIGLLPLYTSPAQAVPVTSSLKRPSTKKSASPRNSNP